MSEPKKAAKPRARKDKPAKACAAPAAAKVSTPVAVSAEGVMARFDEKASALVSIENTVRDLQVQANLQRTAELGEIRDMMLAQQEENLFLRDYADRLERSLVFIARAGDEFEKTLQDGKPDCRTISTKARSAREALVMFRDDRAAYYRDAKDPQSAEAPASAEAEDAAAEEEASPASEAAASQPAANAENVEHAADLAATGIRDLLDRAGTQLLNGETEIPDAPGVIVSIEPGVTFRSLSGRPPAAKASATKPPLLTRLTQMLVHARTSEARP